MSKHIESLMHSGHFQQVFKEALKVPQSQRDKPTNSDYLIAVCRRYLKNYNQAKKSLDTRLKHLSFNSRTQLNKDHPALNPILIIGANQSLSYRAMTTRQQITKIILAEQI